MNVLSDEKRQQVVALGRLRWPLWRIEAETGVRRETAGRYLRAAGIEVGGRSRRGAKPAIPRGVSTDPGPNPAIPEGVSTDSQPANAAISGEVSTDLALAEPTRAPSASACEVYREEVVHALGLGRNAKAIWQDLVDDLGFGAGYSSVKRFVSNFEPTGRRLGDTPRRQRGRDDLTRPTSHAHILKCGPRSWRTKLHSDLPQQEAAR